MRYLASITFVGLLAGCASHDPAESWKQFDQDHAAIRAERDKAYAEWSRRNCMKCDKDL